MECENLPFLLHPILSQDITSGEGYTVRVSLRVLAKHYLEYKQSFTKVRPVGLELNSSWSALGETVFIQKYINSVSPHHVSYVFMYFVLFEISLSNLQRDILF